MMFNSLSILGGRIKIKGLERPGNPKRNGRGEETE